VRMTKRIGKQERHASILRALMRTPSLRIAELATALDVSTETIRRDLDELTAQGSLNRTYGGAVRPPEAEPGFGERQKILLPERERIARATLALVKPGNVLMIGSGTTTVHVARCLAAEAIDLTVITHAFGIASVLSANPGITVIMAPGRYNPDEACTYGARTVSFLAEFQVDRAILGASGLMPGGPTDANAESAAVYSAMVAAAAATTLVADHSKVDRSFLARYATWAQIDQLVTDREIPPPLADRLAASATQIIVAG
jgi:DeoR/GlpR family transcriptional regulator of sugar metabolism